MEEQDPLNEDPLKSLSLSDNEKQIMYASVLLIEDECSHLGQVLTNDKNIFAW